MRSRKAWWVGLTLTFPPWKIRSTCDAASRQTSLQSWSSRNLSLGLERPVFTSLGLGLGTLESRSLSWSWHLGPWRLGLGSSSLMKREIETKIIEKQKRQYGNITVAFGRCRNLLTACNYRYAGFSACHDCLFVTVRPSHWLPVLVS